MRGIHGASYLNVGEVSLDNSVHHSPDVLDRVLVPDRNPKLLSNERSSALTTKEVLSPDRLSSEAIDMLQAHFHGVLGIALRIGCESLYRPGSLDFDTILAQVIDENRLNSALVDKGGEWITRIDKVGAASPSTGSDDAILILGRIPEGDLVDFGGLEFHEWLLQAHVPEQVEGSRLDSVGPSGRCGLRAIVNVLNFIAPSCEGGGEHESDRTSSDNDYRIAKLATESSVDSPRQE